MSLTVSQAGVKLQLRQLSQLEGPSWKLSEVRVLNSECENLYNAGIFDGHRGAQAAEYAAQHFQEHLQSHWQASSASEALQAAFLSLDTSFKHAQVWCLTL